MGHFKPIYTNVSLTAGYSSSFPENSQYNSVIHHKLYDSQNLHAFLHELVNVLSNARGVNNTLRQSFFYLGSESPGCLQAILSELLPLPALALLY